MATFCVPFKISVKVHGSSFCLGLSACYVQIMTDAFTNVASILNLLLISLNRYVLWIIAGGLQNLADPPTGHSADFSPRRSAKRNVESDTILVVIFPSSSSFRLLRALKRAFSSGQYWISQYTIFFRTIL